MKKILAILICFQIIILPAFAEYDFSDAAQEEFDRKQTQLLTNPQSDFSRKKEKSEVKKNPPQEILIPIKEELLYNPTPLYGNIVKVPAGTSFLITFDSGISSGSTEKNDRLTVRLTHDLVYNGTLIAPAGSLVYGTATDAENAGYAYGSGELEINFNEILPPEGDVIKITTENIYFKEKSERAKNMTRDVALGALGSMLVGAAFTALGGGHDWGRNMLIYGGLGALGGGIRGTMQRGQDVNIPDGTTMRIKLIEPLNATQYSDTNF